MMLYLNFTTTFLVSLSLKSL